MQYIKNGLIGVIWLLNTPLIFAQQNKPVKVHAHYDTSAVPELFSSVPIAFTFTFPNGRKESTRGFGGGKIRWNRLKISSPQGAVEKGMLVFDPKKVWENHHKVDFTVQYSDTALSSELFLPYLKSIHFNLYTDSLKRDVSFYLNMEGVFSSGRTYPLDTERIHYEASDGQLNGNSLLLSQSDTAVRQIQVKGFFKWDNSLMDSCSIPVKTWMENPDLPTEKELLNQWKRGRRRK